MLLYLCTNIIGHIYPNTRRDFFTNSSFDKCAFPCNHSQSSTGSVEVFPGKFKILEGIVLYLGNYGSCSEANMVDHVQGFLLFCLLLHNPLALINQVEVLVLTTHCYQHPCELHGLCI